MLQTVTFYRVDLEKGITVEEVPSGWYRGNPELDRTVFKNLRRAKVAFTALVRAEIRRLHALRKEVGPLNNLPKLKAHSFAAFEPENWT